MNFLFSVSWSKLMLTLFLLSTVIIVFYGGVTYTNSNTNINLYACISAFKRSSAILDIRACWGVQRVADMSYNLYHGIFCLCIIWQYYKNNKGSSTVNMIVSFHSIGSVREHILWKTKWWYRCIYWLQIRIKMRYAWFTGLHVICELNKSWTRNLSSIYLTENPTYKSSTIVRVPRVDHV